MLFATLLRHADDIWVSQGDPLRRWSARSERIAQRLPV